MTLSKHIIQESNSLNEALKQLNEHSSDIVTHCSIEHPPASVTSTQNIPVHKPVIVEDDENTTEFKLSDHR